jgi:hypothetical protein
MFATNKKALRLSSEGLYLLRVTRIWWVVQGLNL